VSVATSSHGHGKHDATAEGGAPMKKIKVKKNSNYLGTLLG